MQNEEAAGDGVRALISHLGQVHLVGQFKVIEMVELRVLRLLSRRYHSGGGCLPGGSAVPIVRRM